MSLRALLPALSALLLAATLGGCGSAPDPGGASGAPAPALAPGDALAAPDRTVLVANSTARFGTVVIDGAGWTLYRSDADSARPSTSACTSECTQAWPPVLVQPGKPDYEGISPTLVGSVTRDDGAEQVTIGGWPVYRHAADSKPGAVDGQGSAGHWWAVTPTGARATAD